MKSHSRHLIVGQQRLVHRRQFLGVGVVAAGSGTLYGLSPCWGARLAAATSGVIAGEPTAEKIGMQVLTDGGNIVDAMVAAALAATVAAPHQTGIGGYGGCLVVAQGDRVHAIDFNSAAPHAMREDFFSLDAQGQVKDKVNQQGWLSAGVPGILAGLQMALDRYGSRSFGELVQPAIRLARDGFPMTSGTAGAIAANAGLLAKDRGSRSLYLPNEKPRAAGELFRNPRLAELLDTLAQRNSVRSFYQGDIARQIADAFQRQGGILSYDDLARYEALEVAPLALTWADMKIFTPPPAAGGLTPLQAFEIMRAMNLPRESAQEELLLARIEALRWAWRDRLRLLGDSAKTTVPIERLLSQAYASEAADVIRKTLKSGRIVPPDSNPKNQGGTIHLSAADSQGNLAALTLTHGDAFGSKVTIDELGLTLGHGMSRFDPQPGHPNSPGPGKRPQHNMCPTVVLGGDGHRLAVGGRGGRKIPNAVFEVLWQFVVAGRPLAAAIVAPRCHTEGGYDLALEKSFPAQEVEACRRIGYRVSTSSSATVSGTSVDAKTGECHAAIR